MITLSGASTIDGPLAVLTKRYCDIGQRQHIDGRCVTAGENFRIFLYDAPERPETLENPPYVPEPSIDSNILLIRLGEKSSPVIVPPPLQHQVVYILNRQLSPQVIEAPTPPPVNPKVYYVNYDEGIDLQTVFNVVFQEDGAINSREVTDIHEENPIDSDFRHFNTDGLFRENLDSPYSTFRSHNLPEHVFKTLRRENDDEKSETEGIQVRHYSESDSTSNRQYPYSTEISSYSSLDSPP